MHAPCASDRSASLQHCVSTWRPRHTNHSFVAGATAPSRSNMIWMLTTAQSTKTPTHARNARRHTLLEGSILWRKARWIRLSIHLVSGFLAKSSMESREKSFGAFQCLACKKSWISAHAFKAYKQGCQNCEMEELPLYMWQNLRPREYQGNDDYENDEADKPHDQQRCEACRRGVCTGRGSIGRFFF